MVFTVERTAAPISTPSATPDPLEERNPTIVPSESTSDANSGIDPEEEDGPHECETNSTDCENGRREAFRVHEVRFLPWRGRQEGDILERGVVLGRRHGDDAGHAGSD